MSLRLAGVLAVLVTCFTCAPLHAQRLDPHIGYLYPSGGQRGTTFNVTLGGQHLKGATNAVVSGSGVDVSVLQYVKALTNKEMNDIKKSFSEAQKAHKKATEGTKKRGNGKASAKKGAQDAVTEATRMASAMDSNEWPMDPRDLDLSKMSPEELKLLRAALFNKKKQPNAQLDSRVLLSVTVAPDAHLGARELRLMTAGGLSNPMVLRVDAYPEVPEREPNEKMGELVAELPAVLNGQIMPGDVDRFRFRAKQGERIVASVRARSLIPYLADAVPGWFQAVLTLYDASGSEVAFVDDYRFDPDPVLRYEIPADGEYELLVRDSIYRGREDFVYRITLGALPFVESVYPLGGQAGASVRVALAGWNLPAKHVVVKPTAKGGGIQLISVPKLGGGANTIEFAVDNLDEQMDTEPNNLVQSAQPVKLPLTINGRISRPGDWDVFRFQGSEGQVVVAEILARRLNSPVDSILKLTDAKGCEVAVNDDTKDPAAGLVTHHADSRLMATLPATGIYYVHVGDTQRAGSQAHTYRLRISPPRPDFKLRIMPSSINLFPGTTVIMSAAAIRQDGFVGDIRLRVAEPQSDLLLSGAWIPEGQDRVSFTLTAPRELPFDSVPLRLEGVATIGDREVCRPAIPAEDMMQAFLWRHLVPVDDMLLTGIPTKWRRRPTRPASSGVVTLVPGGTGEIGFRSSARKRAQGLELDIRHPAEGFSLTDVTPVEGGADAILQADSKAVTPGDKGNLILEAFVTREVKDKEGNPTGKTRRNSQGILPAIPFEIVAQ
jgi:hypothetical protein